MKIKKILKRLLQLHPKSVDLSLDRIKRLLKDLKNIKYLTAHTNGGYEMLKIIKKSAKKINKNLRILGVTVLTSLSNKSLKNTASSNTPLPTKPACIFRTPIS